MVAVIVSIAASVYLYREFQKQAQDISNIRTYSANMSKQVTHALSRDTAKQAKQVKQVKVETVTETESDEEDTDE